MKALAITIALLTALISTNNVSASVESKGKKRKQEKTEVVKSSLEREIQKRIYFPQNAEEAMEGKANVMLQVYPDGDVRVVLIQTENPLLKKFIERQVNKMKVDADSVVVGEIFRYRFEFKRQH